MMLRPLRRPLHQVGRRNAVRADLMTRTLAVRAASADPAARTVEVVVATESPVRVYDWERGVIDEVLLMSGCQIPASRQIPMLADHNRYSIDQLRGSLRELRVDGGTLVARAHFAEDAASVDAFGKVRSGHLTDLSAGYSFDDRSSVAADPGQTVTVAGRSFTAADVPLVIRTSWSPREGSLVPIGADAAATFRAAHTSTSSSPLKPGHRAQELPVDFTAWCRARGLDPATLTDLQRTALMADYTAAQQRAAAPVQPATASPSTPAPDPVRAVVSFTPAQIRTMVASAVAFGVPLDDYLDGARYPTVELAIAAMNQTRADRLAAAAPGTPGAAPAAPAVRVIADGGDKMRSAVEDAVFARMSPIAPQVPDQGLRRESLVDLARRSAAITGGSEARDWNSERIRHYAIGIGEFRGRALSTSDFPNVLATVMRRVLIAGFDAAPGTYRQWTMRDRVNDFKKVSAVGIVVGALDDQEAEGAPLKNLAMAEASYSRQAKMKGNVIIITEQTMVNDDLSAIGRQISRLGMIADSTVELAAVKVLLNQSWTGAVTTGADIAALDANGTRAPGEAALSKAYADFMNKTNPAGLIIGAAPRFLLVPANLMVPAAKITTQVAGSRETMPMANLTPIVIPQLAASGLSSNASADNFYLAGDPNLTDTIVVSTIYDRPSAIQIDTGAVPGLGMRIEFPFGVDSAGTYGLQKGTKA